MEALSNLKVETQIRLNRFKPRDYQLNLCRNFDEQKFKKFLIIWPRRSGKDICALSLLLRSALRKVGTYFYIFPTFSMGRRILWDAIDISGNRILDYYIPKELVDSRNEQQMRIKLINGSQIQILGSDNFDQTLVGTNAAGMIFSEYALQDSRAYSYSLPILKASNGWALFVSTPRGKNHLWELYNIASTSPDWFCEKLTIEDTKHIPLEEIEKDISEGQISRDLAMQEYYCDFTLGVEGSFYSKSIDNLRQRNQITYVPWEPYHPVYTAWDLGYNDPTCIIFFQLIGQVIRVIDCYENTQKGLDYYAKIVKEKPYTYGQHIAPFDIAVHDLSTGISRWKTMYDLGITFIRYSEKQPNIEEGIEAVRRNLPKMWFDEKTCEPLVKALENYRQEYDFKRKVYKNNPLHDWSSHYCFTGDTKILTRYGMRQIMDIQENDEILTLHGWKPCTKAMITQKNAQLVEVKFKDGTIVRCTPDHTFLTTERKWISAKDLQKGSVIQSYLTHLRNILREHCIEYGLLSVIFQKADPDFIEMFGKELLEEHHKMFISITEIITYITTPYTILNVCQKKNISLFLDQITKDFLKKRAMLHRNGIDLKKVDYGIKDMPKEVYRGLNGKEKSKLVYIVRKNLHVLFEEMGISKDSAILTAKLPVIERIKYLETREDVWDIGVPDAAQFSLSNGAIVHNCDAMRYLCVALPKLGTKSSPEALDKRYREAMYGENSNMPSVFRTDLPEY